MSDPLVTTRLIREAFSRGVLLGLTLLVTAGVILGLTWLIVPGLMRGEQLAMLLTVFCGGFVVTPVAVIERLAARSRPSPARDVRASLIAGGTTFVAGLLLVFEVFYVDRLQRSGWNPRSALRGMVEAWRELRWLFHRGDGWVPLVMLFGVPTVPAVFGRLRGWALGPQLGCVFGTTLVANLIIVVALGKLDGALVALVTALLASLTPVLFRWGDAAETLWAKVLGRDED